MTCCEALVRPGTPDRQPLPAPQKRTHPGDAEEIGTHGTHSVIIARLPRVRARERRSGRVARVVPKPHLVSRRRVVEHAHASGLARVHGMGSDVRLWHGERQGGDGEGGNRDGSANGNEDSEDGEDREGSDK